MVKEGPPVSDRPDPRHEFEPAPSQLVVTTEAGVTTVAVTGEIDLAVVGRLTARLDAEIDRAPAGLIIDLSAVTFCSSHGLSALVAAGTRSQAAGVACVVVSEQRAVLRPIMLMGLDKILRLRATVAEAREWLAERTEAS
jgi:anti-anti-sigma factor